MAMKRNYKRRPAGKKNYKRRPAKKSLVKTIKKVMNANTETKFVTRLYLPTAQTRDIASYNQWNKVIPETETVAAVFGGSTATANNNNRVGTSIQPRRCTLTIWSSISPQVATRSVICTIYVFKARGITNYAAISSVTTPPSATSPANFLDLGTGANDAFLGNIYDHMLPNQLNNFTILHKKTFILGKGVGLVNGDSVGTDTPITNRPCAEHTFNIPLPHSLKYDESDVNPNNCAIYWAIGYANTDMQGADGPAGGQAVACSALTKLYFKDA